MHTWVQGRWRCLSCKIDHQTVLPRARERPQALPGVAIRALETQPFVLIRDTLDEGLALFPEKLAGYRDAA
jgi:hypothetical protein